MASAAAAPPDDPPAVTDRSYGIAGDAEDLVEGVPAGGELRDVGLADGDHAGLLHPLDHQVVGVRDEVGPGRRAEGGADAGRQVIVLVRHRQSVQRPGEFTAGGQLVLLVGQLERPLGGQRDDGVDPRVHLLDPLQVGGDHLAGADLLGPEQAGQFGGGAVVQLGHATPLPVASTP